MKKKFSLLTLLLLICVIFTAVACETNPVDSGNNLPEQIDYAGTVTLLTDGTNTSVWTKVKSVKAYIDGDTTHFYVDDSVSENGIVKARYLAINTPESTGKIEEWGKTASQYTKNALLNATEIVLESDDGKWNIDSTGARHLVWVWYKPQGSDSYRNLNIELLQNGLAIASNSANNKYGDVCMNAIAQAKACSLYIYSNEKDPLFPYGEATTVTLKELRRNVKDYDNYKVSFEGIITKNSSNTVYVEDYDEETDMYYGMQVYYGYNLNALGLKILKVGNKVRIVGTVTYYETGDTYQVSGLTYDAMHKDNPDNIALIEEGCEIAYKETSANTFANGKVSIVNDDGADEYDYAELAIYTSISMKNLYVKSVYTTATGGDSDGSMTLTCTVDGITVSVRTAKLYDENKNLITEEYFKGKTINVKGIVNIFNGKYQINVFSTKDVTFN